MDRTESGLTDFGKKAERHNIEKAAEAAGLMKCKLSQDIALNFKNDFALATWAPLSLCPYSAENIFYFCSSGWPAGHPELLFHRWSRSGFLHFSLKMP